MGICARYNNVPPQIMLPALSIAMGAVMSEDCGSERLEGILIMRKTNNITAEMRKARKLVRSWNVDSLKIERLPAIARSEVRYRIKAWVFSANLDSYFHPLAWKAFEAVKKHVSDCLFKSDESAPIGGLQALVAD
jgi:hypothetical protein